MDTPPPADAVLEGPDLAAHGLTGLDPDALIRTSSYCALVHAGHQLGLEIAPRLTELKISPSLYLVLGQVLSAPGSNQAAIARRCAMLPQTVASVLSAAEERGLVRRSGPRGRGRSSRIALTDAGVELLLAGWPIVHGAGGDRLTPTQHALLQSLLQQIRGGAADPSDVVVLVDEEARDAGTAPRATVHTTDTPLHRAFSTYLVDASGRLLLTRRAAHKKTWPGVWSNSSCGHSAPGETAAEAALRRVPEELGTTPRDLRVVLPDFRYRATDASGLVENEVCPVLVGTIDAAAVEPSPDEIAEHAWVSWADLRSAVERTPFLLSPWCVAQVRELGEDQPW